MKKGLYILLVLFVIIGLSACDGGLVGNRMKEPPLVVVLSGDKSISSVVSKTYWDGNLYENISSLDSALNVKLVNGNSEDGVTVNFGKDFPDKAVIRCIDYKVTAQEISVIKDVTLGYTVSDGIMTIDSSSCSEDTDIRLYTVTASWDDNSAEYAFALRNANNIPEETHEDKFTLDCEYYIFSAPYDQAHSHSGGTLLCSDIDSLDEFVSAHEVVIDGETSFAEKAEEYNFIITYDFDSVTPKYLKPEVVLSNGRIEVKKADEYKGRLDTTMSVRGYITLISKDVCEVFDISGEDNIYYSWGETVVREKNIQE